MATEIGKGKPTRLVRIAVATAHPITLLIETAHPGADRGFCWVTPITGNHVVEPAPRDAPPWPPLLAPRVELEPIRAKQLYAVQLPRYEGDPAEQGNNNQAPQPRSVRVLESCQANHSSSGV
jgi:hypothetical protein